LPNSSTAPRSIVGENIRRRHLNAGQRAILVALAYPEPTPGKRNDLSESLTGLTRSDRTALSQARCIVKWCPEYVEQIIAGIQIAAAEAWALAEKDGKVQKQGGPRQKAQNGLIAHPREHFGELLGVSKSYVEMARALLQGDPTEAARVECLRSAASSPNPPRAPPSL
jgi:hypothetical protein